MGLTYRTLISGRYSVVSWVTLNKQTNKQTTSMWRRQQILETKPSSYSNTKKIYKVRLTPSSVQHRPQRCCCCGPPMRAGHHWVRRRHCAPSPHSPCAPASPHQKASLPPRLWVRACPRCPWWRLRKLWETERTVIDVFNLTVFYFTSHVQCEFKSKSRQLDWLDSKPISGLNYPDWPVVQIHVVYLPRNLEHFSFV